MDSLTDDRRGLRAHLGNAEKLSIRGDCQELQPECHVCCPAAKEPVQAAPGCSQFGQRLLISPHMLMAGWPTAEGPRRALGSVSLATLKNLVRRRVGEVTITVKGSQVRRLA